MTNQFMISPRASVIRIIHELGALEWGPLAGNEFKGTRAILRALADYMAANRTDLRAEIDVTADQLARFAGYSPRWTRQALYTLEDARVITWKRGGVIAGKPQAGLIRILKGTLCAWIRDLLPGRSERARARSERTARRLEKYHLENWMPYFRRSAHKAVNADLHHYMSTRARKRRARSHSHSSKGEPMKYQKLDQRYIPRECRLGIGRPITCPDCRRIAYVTSQAAGSGDDSYQPQLAIKQPTMTTNQPITTGRRESPIEKLDEYMKAHYPGLHPRYWYDIEKTDPQARRLAVACDESRP